MLLSSGVVWRYREFDRFRAECPGGDEPLQRIVHERLDGDLALARVRSARRSWARHRQPRHLGRPLRHARPDRRARSRAAGELALRRAAPKRSGRARRSSSRRVAFRATASSCAATSRPRATTSAAREPLEHGRRARARPRGRRRAHRREWTSSTAATCRRRRRASTAGLRPARAALRAPRHGRERPSGERYAAAHLVGDRRRAVDGAPATGPRLVRTCPTRRSKSACATGPWARWSRRHAAPARRSSVARRAHAVGVVAGITTTLGGLRVDAAGRVADGVFACGGDAGGISTGGYSSGLAAALVFGRLAAERRCSSTSAWRAGRLRRDERDPLPDPARLGGLFVGALARLALPGRTRCRSARRS